MKKLQLSQAIFLIEDFLTEKECHDFIDKSENIGYEEATVNTLEGPKMMKMIRNNQRVILKDEMLAKVIWERIQSFLPEGFDGWTPISVNEQFRFYKYEPGERFNKHRDGSFRRTENERSLLTLMVYLNDNFEGGETEFDKHTIHPKTGQALVFKHELKHKGTKVTQGVKYAIRTDIMFIKKGM